MPPFRAYRALWLLLAAALVSSACKKDETDETADTTEPPTGDTGTTEPVADGPLTVTVSNNADVFVGATVIFHGPDGAALGTGTTDASGSATFDTFEAGGAVTIVAPGPTTYMLTAFDLDPGTFVADPTGGAGTPEDVGEMDITFPGTLGSATNYQARNGCGTRSSGAADPLSLDVTRRCATEDNRASALGVATNVDGDLVGYSLRSDVLITGIDPAQITLPAWNTDFDDFVVTATNVPATATEVSGSTDVYQSGIALYYGTSERVVPAGGNIDLPMDDVMRGSDSLVVNVGVEYDTTGSYAAASLLQGFTSAPAAFSLDVGTTLLPRVHEANLDLATRVLSFTVDGDLSKADAALTALRWSDGTDDYQWYLHHPPVSDGMLVFPELPAPHDATWPAALADLDGVPPAAFYGTSWIDGWDDLNDAFPPSFLGASLGQVAPFEVWITQGD